MKKLFACRFQINIAIKDDVNMSLIFGRSKKSATIAENSQIPNFGSNSTKQEYFFAKNILFFTTSPCTMQTIVTNQDSQAHRCHRHSPSCRHT